MAQILLDVVALVLLVSIVCAREIIPAAKPPSYRLLPPLREQAKIQDNWTRERIARIPKLLQKYGVDAWLVCPRRNHHFPIC